LHFPRLPNVIKFFLIKINVAEVNKLSLVILAAGESKRFGKAKQLAEIDGSFMLQRVIDQCSEIEGVDAYVVLGARSEQIQHKINFENVSVLYSPNWSEGIGATLASVTTELSELYEGLMFVAGDQPLLGAAQLKPMITSWLENTNSICCAQYDNTIGIPAIFPKKLFAGLMTLRGDSGAKGILLNAASELQTFFMPEAKIDIDYPDDLKKLRV